MLNHATAHTRNVVHNIRKALRLIIGFLILQVFFSCKVHYTTTELESNFTNEQIADLNRISDFFKDQICINKDADFRSCYEKIPHDYLQAYGSGFWTNINFEKQKELYSQISKSTFNEIWKFCRTTHTKSGLDFKSICAISNGKYQKYLADLGKSNPRIAEYAKRIWNSGDYDSFDFNFREIIEDKKDFNLKDPNIQLILAIHYLSLSDQDQRNDEWTGE